MENVRRLAEAISAAGGKCYYVGGHCRDLMSGIPAKDVDIETLGLGRDVVLSIAKQFGIVVECGKSHDNIILKFENDEKIEITVSLNSDIATSAKRRDFTMNSIYIDCLSGEVIDIYGGESDFKNGILKHTSHEFAKDPLRVLRGMQFAARYKMACHPESADFMRKLYHEFYSIPKERIWVEWEKWATKSKVPSMGLKYLLDVGWISHFPEISRQFGLLQDPEYHPEGDVWTHTLMVVDECSAICREENLNHEDSF